MGNIQMDPFLNDVIDQLPVGVILTSVDGVVLFENDVFSVLHRSWNEQKTLLPSFSRLHESVLNHGAPIVEHGEWWNGCNYSKYLEAKISPVCDKDLKVIGSMGVLTDLTVQKNNELELKKAMDRLIESDRVKDNFIKSFSHEVRTPMNSVVVYSELLKDLELEHSLRNDYASRVVESAYQLLSIVDHCLQAALLASGKVVLHKKFLSLSEVCGTVTNVFSKMKGSKDVSMIFQPDLTLASDRVYLDEEKLILVVSHLLQNAFKFTTHGRIVFGYTLIDGFLNFYVKDTGLGIPSDRLLTIFDHFSKVDYALTNNGVGLGLSICRDYVLMMGGTIWAESKIGIGSTFYFTIPYECEC